MNDKIITGPPLLGSELLARLESRMGSMKLIGERDDLLLDAALYVQRTEGMAEALREALADADQISSAPDEMQLDWCNKARAALAKAGVK